MIQAVTLSILGSNLAVQLSNRLSVIQMVEVVLREVLAGGDRDGGDNIHDTSTAGSVPSMNKTASNGRIAPLLHPILQV